VCGELIAKAGIEPVLIKIVVYNFLSKFTKTSLFVNANNVLGASPWDSMEFVNEIL
jgi:hypothetical protein